MLEPLPPDPYKALDLPDNAQPDAIKKRYRELILKCHPDKVPESEKAEATNRFAAVQGAWEILGDAGRREGYHKLVQQHKLAEELTRHHQPSRASTGFYSSSQPAASHSPPTSQGFASRGPSKSAYSYPEPSSSYPRRSPQHSDPYYEEYSRSADATRQHRRDGHDESSSSREREKARTRERDRDHVRERDQRERERERERDRDRERDREREHYRDSERYRDSDRYRDTDRHREDRDWEDRERPREKKVDKDKPKKDKDRSDKKKREEDLERIERQRKEEERAARKEQRKKEEARKQEEEEKRAKEKRKREKEEERLRKEEERIRKEALKDMKDREKEKHKSKEKLDKVRDLRDKMRSKDMSDEEFDNIKQQLDEMQMRPKKERSRDRETRDGGDHIKERSSRRQHSSGSGGAAPYMEQPSSYEDDNLVKTRALLGPKYAEMMEFASATTGGASKTHAPKLSRAHTMQPDRINTSYTVPATSKGRSSGSRGYPGLPRSATVGVSHMDMRGTHHGRRASYDEYTDDMGGGATYGNLPGGATYVNVPGSPFRTKTGKPIDPMMASTSYYSEPVTSGYEAPKYAEWTQPERTTRYRNGATYSGY